jgi:uncharacterized protein with HEPN domain
MPKRNPELLVEDMLDALRKIRLYTESMSYSSFLQDEKTIDAVVRNLEVLGEAARQMPEEFSTGHANVPWRKIAGLRNRIVHDYFGLDLAIVWQIIQNDLTQLQSQLMKVC